MDTIFASVLVAHIADQVEQEMQWLCVAHDFYHIMRVLRVAQYIQSKEWWDREIIELWALLHEYFDDKFFKKEEMIHRRDVLIGTLTDLWLSSDRVDKVLFIVDNVGYGKSLERNESFVWSQEFMIVEDADRLDAIGAIAIARTFAYGWAKDRPICDPTIKPNLLMDRKQYSKKEGTSINHFYEKLLLLKDLIHTSTWATIAQQRHNFMQSYLDQFFREWDTVVQ